MSETALKLLEQIRALPDEEQRMIADELTDEPFDTLSPDEYESEEDATARWKAELDERLAAVADGSAETLPLAEAMAEARAELARRMAAR